MKLPLISIITPIYNAEEFLSKTLVSVINQTYKSWELIAVNDGSKDRSLEILNSFAKKDARIKIFTIKNSGQCVASNYGINNSNGDYIKFLDADDIISENHLELQYKAIENSPNYLASCEWGRFYNTDYKSAKFVAEPVWKDMKSMDWLKISLAQKSDMMPAWLWLIPRNILDKAGFWNEKLSLNNDFDFSIRLLLAAEGVKFAKNAKFYYRSGLSNSLSQIFSQKAVEAAFLTTKLGCTNFLNAENTKETRLLCANRYQIWIYRIYPDYPDIIKKFENEIKSLGTTTVQIEGGRVLLSLVKVFGWKKAKKIQRLLYKLGWNKIANIKRKLKK